MVNLNESNLRNTNEKGYPTKESTPLVRLNEELAKEQDIYEKEALELSSLDEKINLLKKEIEDFYKQESEKIENIVEDSENLIENDNENIIKNTVDNFKEDKKSNKLKNFTKDILEKAKKKTFKYVILPIAISTTAILAYNTPREYYEMFKNYKERHYDKKQKDDPNIKGINELYNDSTSVEKSTYDFLGTDKIDYKNGYYMTSVFDLGDKTPPRFKMIERGDYSKIDSVSGITTNLFKKFYKISEFVPQLKGHKDNKTEEENGNIPVIGYNTKSQEIKAGYLKDFNNDWLISETYEIPLDFKINQDGTINLVYHKQALRMVPCTMGDNGREIPFPVGVTRDKKITKINPEECTRFGVLEGGKVIMVCGDRQLQVNGSFADMFKVFKKLKMDYPDEKISAFLLDNGSYNLPIWDKDNVITPDELRKHFNRNYDGGTALCLINDGKISPYEYKNKYKEYEHFTKNYTLDSTTGKRALNEKTVIVLHHTGNYKDPNQIIRDFTDTTYQLSAHCVIMKDGTRHIFNTDDYVLAHAGKSDFNNKDKVNYFSLGVEIEGDTKNHHQFTIAQLESLIEYLRPRIEKYGIPFDNITTHKIIRENYIKKHPNEKGVLGKRDLDDDVWKEIQNLINKKIYDRDKIQMTDSSNKFVGSLMYQNTYYLTKDDEYSMFQTAKLLEDFDNNHDNVSNIIDWLKSKV